MAIVFTVLFLLAALWIHAATVATPQRSTTSRPQFGTYPPNCGHLYDNDQHQEWAVCMGVDFTPFRNKMKRNDL